MFVNKIVYICIHVVFQTYLKFLSCSLETRYTNSSGCTVHCRRCFVTFIMRNKKRISEESSGIKNGKPSLKSQREASPVKLGASRAAVNETPTSLWLFCLAGVSLLSLVTRLYKLHQPASVWLV